MQPFLHRSNRIAHPPRPGPWSVSRIAVGGIARETSGFWPAPPTLAAFLDRSHPSGDALVGRYRVAPDPRVRPLG